MARRTFPNRFEAACIARDGGVDETAIASVLAERCVFTTDPTVLWWIHYIEARALREERPEPAGVVRIESRLGRRIRRAMGGAPVA